MIITQLNGGLGNQIFQYVLGRVLALKHNTERYLDLGLFKTQSKADTKRQYELNTFNLQVKIASPNLIKKVGQPNKYKIFLNQYFHLNLNPYSDRYIKEPGHHFQSNQAAHWPRLRRQKDARPGRARYADHRQY